VTVITAASLEWSACVHLNHEFLFVSFSISFTTLELTGVLFMKKELLTFTFLCIIEVRGGSRDLF